ncbi:hypothetical protein Barb6XT_03217 [Bacteroidales bacterium Barb6XT]|nr:hypothetical protein Barb6XT_03217 [Bacteroidales bacterium Barb6XT]
MLAPHAVLRKACLDHTLRIFDKTPVAFGESGKRFNPTEEADKLFKYVRNGEISEMDLVR